MASCRSSEGWVYFIGTRPGEPIKIGHTNWPQKRLNNIQGGNHRQLVILAAVMVSDAGGIEARLHDKFAAHRLHGEWFRWSRGVGQLVKAIKSPCPYTLRALKCVGHTLVEGEFRRPEVAA